MLGLLTILVASFLKTDDWSMDSSLPYITLHQSKGNFVVEFLVYLEREIKWSTAK